MITRKTLDDVQSERGFADLTKIDRISDAEIERKIAEDPDLAPPTETLPKLLRARDVRRKLHLSQREFAQRLSIPVTMVREWEHGRSQSDPAIQALLRILDRIPELAMDALQRAEGD